MSAAWPRCVRRASTFTAAGVPPQLAAAVAAAFGIRAPTATQSVALPAIAAGRDVLLKAETGSGKTLAYLLPAVAVALASRQGGAGLRAGPSGVADSGGGDDGEGGRWADVVIAVPTQELVVQVAGVARRLLPAAMASLVVEAYGARGASSRTPVAILVGTPTALRDNVNRRHISRARMLVLDEIDALLSGSFAEVTKSTLLAPFKAMEPAARPQHVFVGATVPARGTASVSSFLEQYYPPAMMQRIETARSHRLARPGVQYAFWQIDSALPLAGRWLVECGLYGRESVSGVSPRAWAGTARCEPHTAIVHWDPSTKPARQHAPQHTHTCWHAVGDGCELLLAGMAQGNAGYEPRVAQQPITPPVGPNLGGKRLQNGAHLLGLRRRIQLQLQDGVAVAVEADAFFGFGARFEESPLFLQLPANQNGADTGGGEVVGPHRG